MGARVMINLTGEGRRFEQMLRELQDKEVRIGFQDIESDTQGEDGEKIYAKAGVRRGPGGEVINSEVSILDIAMWNELGTEHVKPRPFLRKSVDENIAEINSFLQEEKAYMLNGRSAEQILKDIGVFLKGLIQDKIVDGNFEPNKEITKIRKGSDHPLIDTGRMLQSVNYVIRQKGDGD